MQITIEANVATAMDSITIKTALEKLVKNMTKENLMFLGELSEKKDINKKFESKKLLIKSFL